MLTSPTAAQIDAMRALAEAFDHDTLRVLLAAAEGTAATHRVHGASIPELRDQADTLDGVAALLRTTNAMRSFMGEV